MPYENLYYHRPRDISYSNWQSLPTPDFRGIPYSNWQSLPTPDFGPTYYRAPDAPLKLHGSVLTCAAQYRAELETPRELADVLSLDAMRRRATEAKAQEERQRVRERRERSKERIRLLRQAEARRRAEMRRRIIEQQWEGDEGVGGGD